MSKPDRQAEYEGTTVAEVREWLKQFPDDAFIYAYEGESTCIVARDKDDNEQLGYLDACEPERVQSQAELDESAEWSIDNLTKPGNGLLVISMSKTLLESPTRKVILEADVEADAYEVTAHVESDGGIKCLVAPLERTSTGTVEYKQPVLATARIVTLNAEADNLSSSS